MKISKKLLARVASIAASAVFCAAAVTSVPASAFFTFIDRDSEAYDSFLESYTEVEKIGLFGIDDYNSGAINPVRKYYASQKTSGCYLMEEIEGSRFGFTLVKTEDTYAGQETVQSILDEFDSGYKVFLSYDEDNNPFYQVTDPNLTSETVKNARAICSELKEKGLIKDFIYYGDVSDFQQVIWHPTQYGCYNKPEVISQLEGYVEEKGLDCEIVTEDSECNVVPNWEATHEEQVALAQQIYDDLGLSSRVVILESGGSSFATTVDMFNAVYGDATNDSTINLYDAVEISKSLMGMRTFTDTEKIIADYDGDGAVDLYDAVGIAREIMNNK
ncbi:MAG: dockerin type I repeat-containing protein [Oscillospiraceae bacterium]|nr:dockerin type I repeat-containing protein [Oscillospiraceae bacterium]